MSTIINREEVLELSHKAAFKGISEKEAVDIVSSYFIEKNKPVEYIPTVIQFLTASGFIGVAFEKILEEYQKKYHICKVIDTNGKTIAIF